MRGRRWQLSVARLGMVMMISVSASGGRLNPRAVDIASLTLVPQEIPAGSQASGSIRLSGSSESVTRVELSSGDVLIAKVPASVSVPARARSAIFPIGTSSETAGCTRITARHGSGDARSAELYVIPQASPRGSPASLRLDSNTVVATGTVLAHVVLPGPAPDGGVAILLSSGNTSVASVPPSVLVPPGATSQRFVIRTSVTAASTCAVISAKLGGFTSRALLKIVGISG